MASKCPAFIRAPHVTYDHAILGGGAEATVTGAHTKPGQIDHVIVRPGQAALGFSTGAASSSVSYDLVDTVRRASRTASVGLTARKGGADQAELSSGTLRIVHDGAPTTATFTLGSVGEGLPGTVQTVPLRLGRGERLELTPRAWSDLAGGVKLIIRTRGGRILRSGTVGLQATRRVAISRVIAKRHGKKLTVTGRVTRRGTSPVLFVTATVTRNGIVLRRKSAIRRASKVKLGRFSLPITIGAVPRGVRARVDVVLIDEEAGMATARRQVTVH